MLWITCLGGGPGRVSHAAVVVGKSIYSFGGYRTDDDSKEFRPMDVHVLNIEILRWMRVPLSQLYDSLVPFQRYGHTAIAYEKRIYIWGGRNDEFPCNILHYFDTTNHWWYMPKVKGMIPGARDGHSACLNGHQMYIFGGFKQEDGSISHDVHMLDLKELCWSYISTLGCPPCFRDFHSAVVLKNRMYIFGGRSDQRYDETYTSHIIYLDFETFRWHRPYTFGDEPTGRRSHSAFIHSGYMYIFGGFNGNDKHYNEMHRYNPDTLEWKYIRTLGKSPCERRSQSCIVVDDRMYLFGGTSPDDKPRQYSINSDDDSDDEIMPSNLMVHSDLHVFDFHPTLRTLSMLVVMRNKLDITSLPASVQSEIRYLIK